LKYYHHKYQMKKIFILLAILLSAVNFSYSQTVSPAYKETLIKMMRVTGSEATYKAVVDQMVANFRVQKPEVPAGVWTEFGSFFTKTAFTDIVELLLPIYQKHFTEEDLKATIAFYETPAGQKLALESPMVVRESMQAGQQWGQKLGADFAKKLQEKGY
jgi:hypothetical protein